MSHRQKEGKVFNTEEAKGRKSVQHIEEKNESKPNSKYISNQRTYTKTTPKHKEPPQSAYPRRGKWGN